MRVFVLFLKTSNGDTIDGIYATKEELDRRLAWWARAEWEDYVYIEEHEVKGA